MPQPLDPGRINQSENRVILGQILNMA